MMKRVIGGLAASILLATPIQALAGGDSDAGKQKSQACVACHGADGNSPTAQFPKIGGQYETYLFRSLLDYKSGARQNAIMAGIVAGLEEQDMKDLAAYFASQDGDLQILE
jgi:cytochrome c553